MTLGSQQAAFAVFGSAARGDNDRFSDSDLLIVSDDRTALMGMRAEYDAAGWSCTAYSWKRLQRAADQGSLFVQHLKQESKILWDPSDRLANVLAGYSTNPSYKRVSDGASSLLGDLIQHLPECDAGPMWTLDVLFVGFRSLAVATLADEGIYAFSNSDIIGGLVRIGMVGNMDGQELSWLRRYKSLYRRGAIGGDISWQDVFHMIRLVDRVFALELSSRCAGTTEIVELGLASCNAAQTELDWYARCRRIESALLMLKPRDSRARAQFRERRDRLFGIVKSPGNYAWHFTTGRKAIQNNLAELAQTCAV